MGPLDYGKAPERGSKSAARAPQWMDRISIGEDWQGARKRLGSHGANRQASKSAPALLAHRPNCTWGEGGNFFWRAGGRIGLRARLFDGRLRRRQMPGGLSTEVQRLPRSVQGSHRKQGRDLA